MYAYAYMHLYEYFLMDHMYASACIYHHLPAPTTTGGGGILKMSTPPLGWGGVPGGPDAYIAPSLLMPTMGNRQ